MTAAASTPVTIHMKTTIRHSRDHQETSVITADGQMYTKGVTTYVRFQEPIPGVETESHQETAPSTTETPTTTQMIKIQKGEVTVTRKGAIAMNQRFIPGTSTEGMYQSLHGPMAMRTKTKAIQFLEDTTDGVWTLRLRYSLHLQGAKAGDFDIRMTMKEVHE